MFYSMARTRDDQKKWRLIFYADIRKFTKEEAKLNMCQTMFICILLCGAAVLFSTDANNLVLNPVENMIRRVEAIRENPLMAMKMADEEFKSEEMAKAMRRRASPRQRALETIMEIISCKRGICGGGLKAEEMMETVILEKTIIKLGSLLALGFGEAGADIIAANMRAYDSAGVNAMIPGKMVECVIGTARVRNFSTATEVLQAKIMNFVNQIAEIVHGVVNESHGFANKNFGETFLILWKMGATKREPGGDDDEHTQFVERRTCEMSVCAFVTVLAAVHTSPVLATYRTHPGLQLRLQKLKLHSACRVHLSFGLHAGWAIEGAVGSEFKIDASYLSPNVSIARSVEHITEQYGVALALSQSVASMCSKELFSQFRLIDNVIIRGCQHPMHLHCLDLDFNSLQVDKTLPLSESMKWTTRARFRARQFLDGEKTQKMCKDVNLVAIQSADRHFRTMRKVYNVQFTQLFNSGFQNYLQGEWQTAKRMLLQTQTMLGVEDGPSTALLEFMEVPHKSQAPKHWKGVRQLLDRRELKTTSSRGH
jgi:class 3 adenylate cyclase